MRHPSRSFVLGSVLLVLALGSARAQQSPAAAPAPASNLLFEPPQIDIERLCKPIPAREAPKTDWRGFDGKLGDTADMLDAARWYSETSGGAARDLPLARKMLEALIEARSGDRDVQIELARVLLRSGAPADTNRAAGLLEGAVRAGSVPAALMLGRLYEMGDDGIAPDAKLARKYYQIAAIAGEVDGQIGIAKLAKAGLLADVTPDTSERLARSAMVNLLSQLSSGDCTVFTTIGQAYRIGSFVPQDGALAIRWLEKSALLGNGSMAEVVARAYEKGIDAEKSSEKYLKFLTIAAKANRAGAMAEFGGKLIKGNGVPRDREEGTRWLEKLVSQGNLQALTTLYRAWNGDFGDPRDPAKAFSYLKSAAELPNADADLILALSRAYVAGEGIEQNLDKGIALLTRAAHGGSGAAALALGQIYLDRTSPKFDAAKAATAFRIAAQQNERAGFASLSEMHACGLGVPFSIEKARFFEERAALTGQIDMLRAYVARIHPDDIARQNAEIFTATRASALDGSRRAMIDLMLMLRSGFAGPADPAQADRWQERALRAGEGLPEGQLALASALMNGRMVAKDMARARQLIDEVVKSGLPQAHYMLAQWLLQQNGARNDVLAALDTAQRGGNISAFRALSDQLRDGGELAGRNSDAWLQLAADQGDMTAALRIALKKPSGEREPVLDDIVRKGACRPADMLAVAKAYLAAGTSTAADKGRMMVERLMALDIKDKDLRFDLAGLLADGAGGEQGRAMAAKFIEEAAQLGNTKAMVQMANLHIAAGDGAEDRAKAAAWLEKAAATGDMKSAQRLATLLAVRGADAAEPIGRLKGILESNAERSAEASRLRGRLGLDGLFGAEDPATSRAWLEKAANAGDLRAMRELSTLYLFGLGIDQSEAKAFGWLLKAAEAGDARAAMDVAQAFERGLGTNADAQKAEFWRAKAGEKKSPNPTP